MREEAAQEFDAAETFVLGTVRAINSGNPADGLMSGGIVVPKDGSPVHWAPAAVPVQEYAQAVSDGERWWSSGGAEPVTEVVYYGSITPGRTRSDPSGILRRRTAAGKKSDEVYTRNLQWEPTAHFRKYELGHNDDDHVEITAAEAAAFVRRVAHRARTQNVNELRTYSPTEEEQALLANAKESAKRRREMPAQEQRRFPRPDRFSGEPLGSDGDGRIRRSE